MTSSPEEKKEKQQELLRKFEQARGQAINAHAVLESSVCMLMAYLAKLDRLAMIPLFYTAGQRPRLRLLEEYKNRNFPSINKQFFSSLINRIGEVDARRNSVAHWHLAYIIPEGTNNSLDGVPHLVRASASAATGEQVSVDDLFAFTRKAGFISHVTNRFHWFLSAPETLKAQVPASLGIFEQALPYPPPAEHPAFPMYEESADLQPTSVTYIKTVKGPIQIGSGPPIRKGP